MTTYNTPPTIRLVETTVTSVDITREYETISENEMLGLLTFEISGVDIGGGIFGIDPTITVFDETGVSQADVDAAIDAILASAGFTI